MKNLIYLFISIFILSFLNFGVSADVPMKNVKMKLHELEFAETQNIRTIFYKNKEKLEFRFPESKVTISPHSSYIKVDDKIFHMYLPVIYDGTDFFIPAEPFMKILNNTSLPNAAIDSSEEYVVSTAPLYNHHQNSDRKTIFRKCHFCIYYSWWLVKYDHSRCIN
jgi:hypothetical protein